MQMQQIANASSDMQIPTMPKASQNIVKESGGRSNQSKGMFATVMGT